MKYAYCRDCAKYEFRQAVAIAPERMTWPEVIGFMAQVAAGIVVGAVAWGWVMTLVVAGRS